MNIIINNGVNFIVDWRVNGAGLYCGLAAIAGQSRAFGALPDVWAVVDFGAWPDVWLLRNGRLTPGIHGISGAWPDVRAWGKTEFPDEFGLLIVAAFAVSCAHRMT